MKIYTLIYVLSFIVLSGYAQEENKNYDPAFAQKHGADDYGMKSYIFVILRSGENKNDDKAYRDSCFSGHMTNIHKLVEEKKLIIAGPMGSNENGYEGIFIFDVKTKEEAQLLLKGDPAITSDLLAVDLYEWYGPAALSAYLEDSDKVWKIKP